VFQRQAIVNFGTIIHDDEVVTTLTMMMNLCNSFKQMTNTTLISKSFSMKMKITIKAHFKESKSIATVFTGKNSCNHNKMEKII